MAEGVDRQTILQATLATVRQRFQKPLFYRHFLRSLSFLARRRPLQSGVTARAHARAAGVQADGAQN